MYRSPPHSVMFSVALVFFLFISIFFPKVSNGTILFIQDPINQLAIVGNDDAASIVDYVLSASMENDEIYQSALREVRDKSVVIKEKIVNEIANRYSSLSENERAERWALIILLSEMRLAGVPKSLDIFQGILDRKIDDPGLVSDASISSRDEEVMIQMTAVDGLWRLARGGNEDAAKALLGAASHPELEVRSSAVSCYLHRAFASEEERASARDEVAKLLKPEEQFLLNIEWQIDQPPIDLPQAYVPVDPDPDTLPPPSAVKGGL